MAKAALGSFSGGQLFPMGNRSLNSGTRRTIPHKQDHSFPWVNISAPEPTQETRWEEMSVIPGPLGFTSSSHPGEQGVVQRVLSTAAYGGFTRKVLTDLEELLFELCTLLNYSYLLKIRIMINFSIPKNQQTFISPRAEITIKYLLDSASISLINLTFLHFKQKPHKPKSVIA